MTSKQDSFFKRMYNKFFPKWEPIYFKGDVLRCKSKELAPYIGEKMTCEVLERKKGDLKHYYQVIVYDYNDHTGKPMEMGIHEENIIEKLGPYYPNKLK